MTLVYNGYLLIQCPEVIKVSKAQNATCQEIQDTGKPFPHVHSMQAEKAKKGQQKPGDGIINGTGCEPEISLPVHGGNKKQINKPADAQKPEGKEINSAHERFAIIKTM